MSDRICCGYGCAGRAVYLIEPVGEYDPIGWEQVPVCAEHLAMNVSAYIDALDRVQVSYVGADSDGPYFVTRVGPEHPIPPYGTPERAEYDRSAVSRG